MMQRQHCLRTHRTNGMGRFFFCLMVLLAASCGKVDVSNVPYARVYLELDLSFKDKDLVGALNFKEFTSAAGQNYGTQLGYSGVLVVCGFDSSGNTQYYAYDLCCPHEAERNTTVQADNTGWAKCPKCGTKYEIAYGSGTPSEGPSKFALTRFDVTRQGNKLLIRY